MRRTLSAATAQSVLTRSVLTLSVLTLAASCASGPASTPDAPSVAQNARAQAAQQHPQILAEFGGAVEGPLGTYVSGVGSRIATVAGVPGQCTFTVVNTDVVNAFAVPGCYIYVTRGILSVLNSEDELAAVLGHEVGHVTANHGGSRQTAQLAGTGLAILVGVLTGSADAFQMAAQAAQLFTLSYSRDQEIQSDDLGLRYLQGAGYNLFALGDTMDALGTAEALDARVNDRQVRTIPTYARSHPLSADRAARARQGAAATGATPTTVPERIDPYLAALNGMLVGDDPSQGFINGRTFAHPTLRLAFDAPQGFSLQNTARAVNISGPNSIRAQFSGGATLAQAGSLETYAETVLRQVLGNSAQQARITGMGRPAINGLQTAAITAQAPTSQGQVAEVTVVAYNVNGRVFHFAVIGPAGGLGAAQPLINSLRALSQQEVAALRAREMQIVTVARGDTVASLSARMAYDRFQTERFLALNALPAGTVLRPGQQVKVVRYSTRPVAWQGAAITLALNPGTPILGVHDHGPHGHDAHEHAGHDHAR